MTKLDIYLRCEGFVVGIIQLFETLPYRKSVGIIQDQLIRSSGSVGVNLSEADNARTRKEFVSCIGISLKEIKESIYWLRVLKRRNTGFTELIQRKEEEAIQIKKILGSIYIKAKQ